MDDCIEGGATGILDKLAIGNLELGSSTGITENSISNGVDSLGLEVLVEVRVLLL